MKWRLHEIITWVNFNLIVIVNQSDAKEYCDRENFKAVCSQNQMIWIESAKYGRMRKGRCITGELETGCFRDVTDYLQKRCTGKQTCEVDVNSIGNEAQPCNKDFVSYLDAEFKCINVAVGDPVQCNTLHYTEITASRGILSSLSYNFNFGITTCPWLIRAKKGQQIQLNITVYDNAKGTQTNCPYSVKIEDHNKIVTKRVCGYSSNMNHLYTSLTNVISVYNSFGILTEGNIPPTFVVSYQMIGCPDIDAPHFSSVTRTGHDLTVRCDETKETWFLTCKDNKWMGEMGNCTTDPEKVTSGKRNSDSHIPFPQGLIAAVILGLILGIIIGFTSLGCYVLHRKRKHDGIAHSVIDTHSLGYSRKDQYNDVTLQQRDSTSTTQSSYYTGTVNPLSTQQLQHQPHTQQHYDRGGGGDLSGDSVGMVMPTTKSLLYEAPLIPESLLDTGNPGVHRISSVGNSNSSSNHPHQHHHHLHQHHRQNYELPSIPKQQMTRRDIL